MLEDYPLSGFNPVSVEHEVILREEDKKSENVVERFPKRNTRYRQS